MVRKRRGGKLVALAEVLRLGNVRSEKEGMSVSRRFRIGKEGGQIEKKKGV